jgi:hypothetical protein
VNDGMYLFVYLCAVWPICCSFCEKIDLYIYVVWTMTYIDHIILLRTYLSYDIDKEFKIKN